MIDTVGFEDTSVAGLAEQIREYFEEDFYSPASLEIISCNYQAFQTNNYADHMYSALIIYKTTTK